MILDTESLELILIFLLLLLSAFFSGAEVSLFLIDKTRLNKIQNSNKVVGNYLAKLLRNPQRLLVSIIIGNTIAHIAISVVSVSFFISILNKFHFSQNIILIAQIFIVTLLVLVFGEVTPKLWASKNPISFAKAIAIPLYWINVLLYPISKISTEAIKKLVSSINYNKVKKPISTHELEEIADIGAENGTFNKDEKNLLEGFFSFMDVTVREVMTPRVDVIAVDENTEFSDVVKIIQDSGHSRIPLYSGTIDNIIGVIYAKDLIKFLSKNIRNVSLRNIARSVIFVPETKLINDSLHEFQEKKIHMGIVVDEYGGTAGVITLEDVIEEIIGDIKDEYDKEAEKIIKIDDNKFVVQGDTSIDEINDALNIELTFENNDFDTMAGFIYCYAGKIPEYNYSITHQEFKFTVKEIVKKRIKKIIIEDLRDKQNGLNK